MSDPTLSPAAANWRAVSTAMRWVKVCLLFGLFYLNFRIAWNMDTYRPFLLDAFGNRPLSGATENVFRLQNGWIILNLAVPICAVLVIVKRGLDLSLRVLKLLALIAIIEFVTMGYFLLPPTGGIIKAVETKK